MKTKRILLAALVCLTLLTIAVGAATDGYYTYSVTKDKATITKVDAYISGDVTIPSTLGGYPVTVIGEEAFRDCSKLTGVVIPDSVTGIGRYAFSGCDRLTSITLPDSVTFIQSHAFSDCSGLKKVTVGSLIRTCKIPELFPDSYQTITDIVLTDSVAAIDAYAFSGCAGLTDITVPNSVKSIGESAFYKCTGLKSITVGSGVTSIGTQAFFGCDGLQDVRITDLAAWCNIDFSDSCSTPFYYASNLYVDNVLITDLVIPDGTKNIKKLAFQKCIGLTSVTIPDSVETIGDYAFNFCFNLTSVTVGNGVTSIGERAFYDCTGLKNICITDVATWCNIDFYDCYSNPFSYANHLYVNNVPTTDLVIPDGVKTIKKYAFQDWYALTSVTVPGSVTSIEEQAFFNCHSLKDVYITDLAAWCGIDFYDVHSNPIYYASNLYVNGKPVKDLVIPDGVKTVKKLAFAGCTATSVTLPGSAETIGDRAFYRCFMTSATIPDSVTNIGDHAFYDCNNLSDIYYTGTKAEWNSIEGLYDAEIPYGTVIRFQSRGGVINSIDLVGDTVAVSVRSAGGVQKDLYVAEYDAVGRLIAVVRKSLTAGDNECELPLEDGCASVKAFVTDNAFIPLCAGAEWTAQN